MDVEHYRLDVAFDPEHKQVSGQVSIRFTAIRDSLPRWNWTQGPWRSMAVVLDEMEEAGDGLEFRHDGETLRVELAPGAAQRRNRDPHRALRRPAEGGPLLRRSR